MEEGAGWDILRFHSFLNSRKDRRKDVKAERRKDGKMERRKDGVFL